MNFPRIKDLIINFPRLKDIAVFLGWMAGLLLIGGLLWSLTEPVRSRSLQRTVNRVLADREEPLLLNDALDRRSVKRIPLGTWYSIDGSGDRILVFPLISGGAILPCGAVVSPEGKVERVIPLGVHGAQLFRNLPQGILQIYIHRIEEEEQ